MEALTFTVYLLNFKQYLSQSPQIGMEITDNNYQVYFVVKLSPLNL
jgi:hypothetical protein